MFAVLLMEFHAIFHFVCTPRGESVYAQASRHQRKAEALFHSQRPFWLIAEIHFAQVCEQNLAQKDDLCLISRLIVSNFRSLTNYISSNKDNNETNKNTETKLCFSRFYVCLFPCNQRGKSTPL